MSPDLDEHSHAVAVVAGPKAILDVPPTLEYLEIAAGCRRGDRRGARVLRAAVGLGAVRCRTWPPRRPSSGRTRRWAWGRARRGNLVPEADALDRDVAREAIDRALREADEAGVSGGAVTPWLLARVAAITEGASVTANVALIVDNAGWPGSCAGARVPDSGDTEEG